MLRALLAFLAKAFGGASGEPAGNYGAIEGGTPHLPPMLPTKETVRLAIVVGHNSRQKGACSPYIGECEFDFNTKVAQMISGAAKGTGVEVKVFYRQYAGSYTKELKAVYAEVDAWGADCSIELHYNAFDGPANGSETLHSTSAGSTELAEIVHRCMLDCFGLKNRGLVKRKRFGKRGWYSMYAGKAPAILIEPGFGSHPLDAEALKNHWPLFAKDLIHAVQVWKQSRS